MCLYHPVPFHSSQAINFYSNFSGKHNCLCLSIHAKPNQLIHEPRPIFDCLNRRRLAYHAVKLDSVALVLEQHLFGQLESHPTIYCHVRLRSA